VGGTTTNSSSPPANSGLPGGAIAWIAVSAAHVAFIVIVAGTILIISHRIFKERARWEQNNNAAGCYTDGPDQDNSDLELTEFPAELHRFSGLPELCGMPVSELTTPQPHGRPTEAFELPV